jgi:hypothetical protein
VRLRAQIVIDIEAADFADAAVHQQTVEGLFGQVRNIYDQAHLDFRQRRIRPQRQTVARNGVLHYTGHMNEYED